LKSETLLDKKECIIQEYIEIQQPETRTESQILIQNFHEV